mgnify:CR=1 FL=1
MKKVTITFFVVIVSFLLIYSIVWYESYQNSLSFYEQATENFEDENYGLALKGGEVFDEELNGYRFIGGYEQVLAAWSNKWAIPKPSVYYNTEEKISEIINEKMTADQGIAIFQEYFRVSNRHLPEILIQTGKLYKENGEIGKAKEIFKLAIDAFGRNEKIKKQAEEQLSEIE